jgi:hypothetical protein
MGGVVSEVVSGVGDLGQGVISGVSDLGVSIDQGVRDTLGPNGWTTAALLAGGYYYAPEIGAYINATSGSTVPLAAVSDAGAAVAADNAYLATQALTPAQIASAAATSAEASQVAGLAGSALGSSLTPQAIASGASGALAADNAYLASQALTPAQASAAAASSVEASQLSGLAASPLGAQVGTGTGLLGSAIDWAKANPLSAAGLALAASSALGGSSTPSSSSSIDPDVKAAYLQNLADARATAAGLAPKQFAAFPEYNLGMVQKYMNPYESDVIQGTLSDIERARQGQISAEGAAATAAKAFGGTRQGVTRSLVDEAALRNATNAVAQLRQTGFSQAQNLGLSQEALRQQYEQSKLDAARNIGVERLGISQGALSLQPSGNTQSAPLYTNPTASALGGALGGAQLGSLFGGTSGAQIGAGIGGLLGYRSK